MLIELAADGTVINTADDDSGKPWDWYPEDTVIAQETPTGKRLQYGPLRISATQAPDWPQRAARQWNPASNLWEGTGGQPQESDLERVVRLLRNNPVDELPASPSPAQVVAKVNELARHAEGRRKLWLKTLRIIGRRIHNG